jgi:CRISPR-associated protein Csd1
MGENAPVSEGAAAAYALALNDLLASDDTSFRVGDVVFCFWAGREAGPRVSKFKILSQASPRNVAAFLKEPFAGIDRKLARQEVFFTVALSANAGRVVVRQWIRTTLEQALLNFKRWFEDLEIVSLAGGAAQEEGEEKGGPCSLFRLAAALVRESKELKRASEVVTDLYHAALESSVSVPSLALLEPLLAEFRSALVTDSKKKPRYPFNRSRFALLKLILLRNAKGGFMPKVHLATDTTDQAYNLGRLLALFSRLQKKAHEGKLEGPGVVERYYAGASSAPGSVYPVLVKLHNHHLRKLEQGGAAGVRVAGFFRNRIAEVLSRFPSDESGTPQFRQTLDLEAQGRFALGFYQQLAYERAAGHVRRLLRDARKARNPDEADALLREAAQAVAENDYPDLARAVQSAARTTNFS